MKAPSPLTAVLLAPRIRQALQELSQTGRLKSKIISVHDYTELLLMNQ